MWGKGCATLVGDAAHMATPMLAQVRRCCPPAAGLQGSWVWHTVAGGSSRTLPAICSDQLFADARYSAEVPCRAPPKHLKMQWLWGPPSVSRAGRGKAAFELGMGSLGCSKLDFKAGVTAYWPCVQSNGDCVGATYSIYCLLLCRLCAGKHDARPEALRAYEAVRQPQVGPCPKGGSRVSFKQAECSQTRGHAQQLPALDHIAVELFYTRQPTELQVEVVQGKSVELFKQFKQGNPAMKVGEGCSCQHWCICTLHVHLAWVLPSVRTACVASWAASRADSNPSWMIFCMPTVPTLSPP